MGYTAEPTEVVATFIMDQPVTLNSKSKCTLSDMSSTQWILKDISVFLLLDFKGSFLLSARKITKCILSFGVECRLFTL